MDIANISAEHGALRVRNESTMGSQQNFEPSSSNRGGLLGFPWDLTHCVTSG